MFCLKYTLYKFFYELCGVKSIKHHAVYHVELLKQKRITDTMAPWEWTRAHGRHPIFRTATQCSIVTNNQFLTHHPNRAHYRRFHNTIRGNDVEKQLAGKKQQVIDSHIRSRRPVDYTEKTQKWPFLKLFVTSTNANKTIASQDRFRYNNQSWGPVHSIIFSRVGVKFAESMA